MKLKASKKSIKENFNIIYSVGYCNLQYLLNYFTPFAYSVGVYGWSCDYYQFNNICISTGYSPIGKELNYETIRKYNKLAKNLEGDFEDRKKLAVALINEFLREVENE